MLKLSLNSPLTENMAAKAQALPGKGIPWQSGCLGTGAGTFREVPTPISFLFPSVCRKVQQPLPTMICQSQDTLSMTDTTQMTSTHKTQANDGGDNYYSQWLGSKVLTPQTSQDGKHCLSPVLHTGKLRQHDLNMLRLCGWMVVREGSPRLPECRGF